MGIPKACRAVADSGCQPRTHQGLTNGENLCDKCGEIVSLCRDKRPVCGSSEKEVIVPASKESDFFVRLLTRNEEEEKTVCSECNYSTDGLNG